MINKTTSQFSKQDGFSLMEVMIVIFLSSILLIGLLNIYDWQKKTYSLESARITSTSAARKAMNSFTEYIAQGYSINTSGTFESGATIITTGGTALVISVPAVDASGNGLVGSYDVIGYQVISNTLYFYTYSTNTQSRRYSNPHRQALAHNIKSLSFTYSDPDPTAASAVTVTVSGFDKQRNNREVSLNLTETIFLRNK